MNRRGPRSRVGLADEGSARDAGEWHPSKTLNRLVRACDQALAERGDWRAELELALADLERHRPKSR